MNHLPPDFRDGYRDAAPWTWMAWQALERCANPTPRVRIRSPTSFDGTKPEQLRPFLFNCEQQFRADPRSFATEEQKVNYAVSYLDGVAAESFQNEFLNPDPVNPVPWISDWTEFAIQLSLMFGIPDAIGNAEDELNNLKMDKDHTFSEHLVTFNRWAAQTDWNSSALRNALWRSLPRRLTDALAGLQDGVPRSLALLKARAQTLDSNYWARQNQIQKENTRQGRGHSQQSAVKSSTTTTTTTTKASASAPPRNESDRVGNRIGQIEKDRRMTLRLCLWCGLPGHIQRDCEHKKLAQQGREALAAARKAVAAFLSGSPKA